MTPATVMVSFVALTSLSSFSGEVARAEVRFGPSDVSTVFYISKSDDRNRVDYGVRLDADCHPIGDQPIFSYWRRFEPNQPRIGELNELDEQAYGIVWQRASTRAGRSRVVLQLRALTRRPITVVIAKGDDDRCEAHAEAMISARLARLDHVFVQLASFLGVDHIEVHGTDLRTRARIREEMRE